MATVDRPPAWYWIVAVLLTLWGVAGCFAAWIQIGMAPAEIAALPEPDRAVIGGLPGWFDAVYAAAVLTGLAGGIAFLLRSRLARVLFAVSLVLIVIQFGYVFLFTPTFALKGWMTVPFPLFIAAVAAAAWWFAGHALARGWLR